MKEKIVYLIPGSPLALEENIKVPEGNIKARVLSVYNWKDGKYLWVELNDRMKVDDKEYSSVTIHSKYTEEVLA